MKYEKATAEVIELDNKDVITASGGCTAQAFSGNCNGQGGGNKGTNCNGGDKTNTGSYDDRNDPNWLD